MAYLMTQNTALRQSPQMMKTILTTSSLLKGKLPAKGDVGSNWGLLLNNGIWGRFPASNMGRSGGTASAFGTVNDTLANLAFPPPPPPPPPTTTGLVH